jgi:hypothetical protein
MAARDSMALPVIRYANALDTDGTCSRRVRPKVRTG